MEDMIIRDANNLFRIVPQPFVKEFLEQVEETYCGIFEQLPKIVRLPSVYDVADDTDFDHYKDELTSHIFLGDTNAYELLEGDERQQFLDKADDVRDDFLIDTITALRFFCFAYQDTKGIDHYNPIKEVW